MASGDAWNAGWNLGSQLAAHRQARKEDLSDKEFGTNFNELQTNIGNLQQKLATFPEGSKERDAVQQNLAQALEARNSMFAKQPGAMQKFGHLLHLTKAEPTQLPAPPGYQPTLQTRGQAAPVKPPRTPGELRARAEAQMMAGAAPAPLTAQQQKDQAIQKAQAGTAGMMETVQGGVDAIKKFHPDATPEELKKLTDNYLDTALGTIDKKSTLKPLMGTKPYKGADGRYYQSMQNSLTGAITAEPMPEGYTAPEQRPLPPATQYMQALVKRNEGQTLTPQEEAVLTSFPKLIYQTSVRPGEARMVAGAQARPMQVVNPDNPNQTIVVSAGKAERGKYATPASVSYQVNVAGHKAMIPKGLGSNLAALGTAEDHLKMASGMVDALCTGDYPLLNRFGLAWAQATGDTAPTDFETVKTSLEGEMARAFTGVGATQGEIASVGSIINKANSPQALKSALNYARQTMEARRKNLWAVAGQAGLSTPGGGAPAPGGGAPRAYKQTATGPNGHKIGSNDGGNTWFDVKTGKAVR
jgi:hypothetical protein